MVAQMPPGEAKSLLDLMGNMTPSESSRRSCHRGRFPGWWMLPMKDGKRQEKREKNKSEGKRARGPAGCQEASCV